MTFIPGIINNTDQALNNINVISEGVKSMAPGILREIESAAKTAKVSIESASETISRFGSDDSRSDSGSKKETEGFMSYVRIIEEIIEIIYRACSISK